MRRGRTTREEKRAAALERAEARRKRGDAGQLARLERMGHGHCREAQRLRDRIKEKKDGEQAVQGASS